VLHVVERAHPEGVSPERQGARRLVPVRERERAVEQALAQVTVAQATLKLGGDPLPQSLARSANPEVALAVVLEHPPQGSGIELSCEWRAADGKVRHMNRWQTKSIDRDVWSTQCRHACGGGDRHGKTSQLSGQRIMDDIRRYCSACASPRIMPVSR
jgi:hypothetical protein